MFDTINGIPIHPLVVHAVVVLLPLGILGTIALVVRPAWRRHYGPLVIAVNALGVVLCPVATSSGEALESHVGIPGEHAEMGDALVWFAIPMLLLSIALVWLDRREPERRPGPTWLPAAVSVLAVVASLACAVQVYRVGDSGARAAWAQRIQSSSGQGG